MVMLSSTLRGRVLKFASAALAPNDLFVLSFEGRESISTPYRFEVELVSKRPDLDGAALLQAPAFLAVKQGIPIRGSSRRGLQTLKIHGVLASFELVGQALGWVSYRAVLVPPLWRLSLSKRCRIFLDKNVPEIVEDVLKTAGFAPEEYEVRSNARAYPKREYVVQYQESDLDFLQRLLEHEGISYFFEHDDERGKVVFGDAPTAFVPVPGESQMPFRPPDGQGEKISDWFDPETIRTLICRESPVSSEVVLQEYNYRTPSVDLHVTEPVASDGFGPHYEYGNHYKDPSEGQVYAKLRAEELLCRRRVFRGEGDARAFRAGATFTLFDHFRGDFNTVYLLTDVRHKASQSLDLSGTANRALAKYGNEFDAIAADVPFRPARTTPKPKITGTLHAKVDASGDGKYAEIDDQGRYKVRFPLDLSGRENGAATRWIRMAQPYSGPDYGFHFPLHKGAEVILTHLDGDPDRPIIASAVPNPETGSPIKAGNQSQCMIKTGGGNKLVIEDSEGSENITMFSPHAGSSFSMGGPGSGFAWTTTANSKYAVDGKWDCGVGGDFTVKILGAEHSLVIGHSTSITVGTKKEIAASASFSTTAAVKGSVEASVSWTATFGASFTARSATQYTRVGGAWVTQSPTKFDNYAGAWAVESGASIYHGAPNVTVEGSTSILLDSCGTGLKLVSGAANLISTGTVLISATGSNTVKGASVSVDGSGSLNLGSDGPIHLDGANIEIEAGGAVNIDASNFNAKASAINLKGSPVSVDGSCLEVKTGLVVKGTVLEAK